MHLGPMAYIGSDVWNELPSLLVWLASLHPADVSLNVISSETASSAIEFRCPAHTMLRCNASVYVIRSVHNFSSLSVIHLCPP